MIRIIDIDDILSIRCPVSEFVFSMTYCEYMIPFYIHGIKPPEHIESETRKVEGKTGHDKEEKTEIEKIERGEVKLITKEELFTRLPDMKSDVEFTREDVMTKLLYQTQVDERNIELLLTGRADKILRKDGCLIVQEDKFPRSPLEYINRSSPFNSQTLQALIYLNSRFKKKDSQITMEDFWTCKDINKLSGIGKLFEIPHQHKKWIINIRNKDIETDNIVKTYEGIQTEQDKIYLEGNLYRFICIILGKTEKIHHCNIKKCRPCEFASICRFSLKID